MKKKLAILLTVLMVLTAVAPSFAATIIIDQPPVGQDAALDELIMLGVLKEILFIDLENIYLKK